MANSLVMTPLEAKGLEFDDVFLYNFFEDAPESANFTACVAVSDIHFYHFNGLACACVRGVEISVSFLWGPT